MSYSEQIKNLSERLANDRLDNKTKHSILTELCDNIESFVSSKDYELFLTTVYPVLLKYLQVISVSFQILSYDHKLRNITLEIIFRLISNNVFKPYAVDLVEQLYIILKTDNEENAILSIKIIADLHRLYKEQLLNHTQPFIAIVLEIYSNMPALINESFNDQYSDSVQDTSIENLVDTPSSPKSDANNSSNSTNKPNLPPLLKPGLKSFKTLAECPVTIVGLINIYKQLVNITLPTFIPKVITFLKLEVSAQKEIKKEIGDKFHKIISPKIKNKKAYEEFVSSQVKSANFLAYASIRGYITSCLPKDTQKDIPNIIIRLLQDCPNELYISRKELLLATRHILSSNIKPLFVPKLDILLTEGVLIGDMLTNPDSLNQLAYSIFADFLHHVRNELNSKQIWKVVFIFADLLLNCAFAISTLQLLGSKLLVNLFEVIVKLPKEEGRTLSFIIINAFADRLELLNHYYQSVLYKQKLNDIETKKKNQDVKSKDLDHYEDQASDLEDKGNSIDVYDSLDLNELIKVEDDASLGMEYILKNEYNHNPDEDVEMTLEPFSDIDDGNPYIYFTLKDDLLIKLNNSQNMTTLKEFKIYIKTLLSFLKNAFLVLNQTNPPPPSPEYNIQFWNNSANLFSSEQVFILKKLFTECIFLMRFFRMSKDNDDKDDELSYKHFNLHNKTSKDEKEMIELISTVFAKIDISTFNEILKEKISFLFSQVYENDSLVYFFHFFLNHDVTSANFFSITISYLGSNLEKVHSYSKLCRHTFFGIFKLSLLSLNSNARSNESLLLLHVTDLLSDCLKHSKLLDNPEVYYQLINVIFKAININKSDSFCNKVLPIMRIVLETFSTLTQCSRSFEYQQLFVEICLNAPIQITRIPAYLRFLLKPLIIALDPKSSNELNSLGITFLESVYDNFKPSFIDPIMMRYIDDIMKVCWKQIHTESLVSHRVARFLGKLGGRNRSFIEGSYELEPQGLLNQELLIQLDNINSSNSLSIGSGIQVAVSILSDDGSANDLIKKHYKINAFRYLSNILKLFIDLTDLPQNYSELISKAVSIILKKERLEDKKLIDKQMISNPRKLSNREELIETLLSSIFLASNIPELKEEVTELTRHLSFHFCQLYISRHVMKKRQEREFNVDDGEGKIFINEHVFLNSIIFALSSRFEPVRNCGVFALECISEFSTIAFGNFENNLHFVIYRSLLVGFFHSCYDSLYYKKYGGVLGLKTLIENIKIPMTWFSRYQNELIQALFFVLKDKSFTYCHDINDISISLIKKIIVKCNKDVNDVGSLPNGIIPMLLLDISNSSKIVRDTSTECLSLLADSLDISLNDIVAPARTILLNNIFGKPLRFLPVSIRIGNIEGLNFWLSIPKSEHSFIAEVQLLLREIITIVEADDSLFFKNNKPLDHETKELWIELKCSCINLLKTVLHVPEYLNASSQTISKMNILTVLFQTLGAKDSRVIIRADEAICAAISGVSKLPKELLQNGLRPILSNLSDYRKLNVSNLEVLANLIVLLKGYFKNEIGNKLLDHLKSWATPQNLHSLSNQDLDSNSVMKIVCGILNIFHLLSPKSFKFIPQIAEVFEYLEKNLRRVHNSPFRIPIGKFFDRFPTETIAYYLKHFSKRQDKLSFFIKHFSNIRESASIYLSRFIKSFKEELDLKTKVVKYANLMDIVFEIASSDAKWMEQNLNIFQELHESTKYIIQNNSKLQGENASYFFQLSRAVDFFELLMIQFLQVTDDIDILISFTEFITAANIHINIKFGQYLLTEVVKSGNIKKKQEYLLKCINKFIDPNATFKLKILMSTYVILPMLIFQKHQGNMKELCVDVHSKATAQWINVFHSKIWRAGAPKDDKANDGLDEYRIQLLQITTLLIKCATDVIENFRKDVIKFNWSFFTVEDIVTKHASYLSTSYFISVYATPSKIRNHILFALLRDHNSETRNLVKQSLDLLTPMLFDTDSNGNLDISWLKYTRRVISENSLVVNNTINVFKFMVTHSDLFYHARHHFVGQAISAMGKLTIAQNTSVENQTLAIEIAEMILEWEDISRGKQRVPQNRFTESTKEYSTPEGYFIAIGEREGFITLLIRYVCINTLRINSDLGKRALHVIHKLLSSDYWPDIRIIELSFFNKFLVEPDFKNTNNNNILCYCMNSLEVLKIILEHKSNEWILENLGTLQKLLEKAIKSDNHDVQETLQKVLCILLKAIKEESDEDQEFEIEDIKNFLNLLTSVINEDLSNTSSLAAGVALCWTVANYKPERLNSLFPIIMKGFAKLCKDHVTINSQNLGNQSILSDEAKMTSKLLDKILCFSAMRISHLGEQRRTYISILAQLIEKTNDYEILSKILKIIYKFIFNRENIFPTSKEKAAILSKMMCFEEKADIDPSIVRVFYKILIKIFEDPLFEFSDLTQRLQEPFILGTRVKDVGIRRRFMKILNDSIEPSFESRLLYVFKHQTWSFLRTYPWLVQSSELLLGAINSKAGISLPDNEYKFAPLGYIKDIATFSNEGSQPEVFKNEQLESLISTHQRFLEKAKSVTFDDIIIPLMEIQRYDVSISNSVWSSIFVFAAESLDRTVKLSLAKSLVLLLSKEYILKYASSKNNIVQGLLNGASKCEGFLLPPAILEYLGDTFNDPYDAISIIETIRSYNKNEETLEIANNAYCGILSKLQEKDLFFGLWRKRAKFETTVKALSFEQVEIYDKAMKFYEEAQIKARSGYDTYSDSEYTLWENHWMSCAENLQQWDLLAEVAKSENFIDLMLESGWRIANWIDSKDMFEQYLKGALPTPRNQVFKSLISLQGVILQQQYITEVSKSCEEGIELAISKWITLPERPTNAHKPLLHAFQQYVEYREAAKIYGSIMTTNVQNSDVKISELTDVLKTWRERLPNVHDDILVWNDLVCHRIHIYNILRVLNRPFLGNNNGGSQDFRGSHEIAFMINRFAKVAREHNLTDIATQELLKIYNLPNIEIYEAFIRLLEEARCHYKHSNEMKVGLESINTTNLSFFSDQQKATFHSMKGMFQAKLGSLNDANLSFTNALTLDSKSATAWVEWGNFNNSIFKKKSNNQIKYSAETFSYASNALTCFLTASGLLKNNQTRRCLANILWLLSLDDPDEILSKEYFKFSGEVPVWYWISFIPQLLSSLSHKEKNIVKSILILIAKQYPQALHLPLRVSRDDYIMIQKQSAKMKAAMKRKETEAALTLAKEKETALAKEKEAALAIEKEAALRKEKETVLAKEKEATLARERGISSELKMDVSSEKKGALEGIGQKIVNSKSTGEALSENKSGKDTTKVFEINQGKDFEEGIDIEMTAEDSNTSYDHRVILKSDDNLKDSEIKPISQEFHAIDSNDQPETRQINPESERSLASEEPSKTNDNSGKVISPGIYNELDLAQASKSSSMKKLTEDVKLTGSEEKMQVEIGNEDEASDSEVSAKNPEEIKEETSVKVEEKDSPILNNLESVYEENELELHADKEIGNVFSEAEKFTDGVSLRKADANGDVVLKDHPEKDFEITASDSKDKYASNKASDIATDNVDKNLKNEVDANSSDIGRSNQHASFRGFEAVGKSADESGEQKPEKIRPKGNDSKETKAEEIKSEENNADEHNSEGGRPVESKVEEAKSREDKSEKNKPEEIKQEETKSNENKSEENKSEENKREENKAEGTKSKENNFKKNKSEIEKSEEAKLVEKMLENVEPKEHKADVIAKESFELQDTPSNSSLDPSKSNNVGDSKSNPSGASNDHNTKASTPNSQNHSNPNSVNLDTIDNDKEPSKPAKDVPVNDDVDAKSLDTRVKSNEATEKVNERLTAEHEMAVPEPEISDQKHYDSEENSIHDNSESRISFSIDDMPEAIRQPWAFLEDITGVSKEFHPLLIYSMDRIVDEVTQRFKSSADEDAYRFIMILLNDGMFTYSRMTDLNKESKLPEVMVTNIAKVCGNVFTRSIRIEFEKDFLTDTPTFVGYIRKLTKWKERFEAKLDRRFSIINLENLCPELIEFHHNYPENIEIFGQYLMNKDGNSDFVKIERFLADVKFKRNYSSCEKRLQIRGNNGLVYEFSMDYPSSRHSKREEKLSHFFRLLNDEIKDKAQLRSRNISLSTPIFIAFSPQFRIIEKQRGQMNFFKIYEQHCLEKGNSVDDPFFYLINNDERSNSNKRVEIFKKVQELYSPKTIFKEYFFKLYNKFEDFWLFRKAFTSQYSSFIFMTYLMSITGRLPNKIDVSVFTGKIISNEMSMNKIFNQYPANRLGQSFLSNASFKRIPFISNNELVPFRLTPNIQELIGDVGIEGILSVHIFIIANLVCDPDFKLDELLNIFIRDEILSFYIQTMKTSNIKDSVLREIVRVNIDLINAKVLSIGKVSNGIVTRNINELINRATSIEKLAQLEPVLRAYI